MGPTLTEPSSDDGGGDGWSPEHGTGRRVSVVGLLKTGLRTVGPHRGSLLWLSAFALLSALVETAALYLIGRMAVGLAEGASSIEIAVGPVAPHHYSLESVILATAAFVIALAVSAIPLGWSAGRVSSRTSLRLYSRFTHAYLNAEWSARTDVREGYLQRMLGDYAQRAERLVQQVSLIIAAICGIVVLATAALVISPVPALLAVVGAALIGIVLRPLSKAAKRGSNRYLVADKTFTATAVADGTGRTGDHRLRRRGARLRVPRSRVPPAHSRTPGHAPGPADRADPLPVRRVGGARRVPGLAVALQAARTSTRRAPSC